LPDNYIGPGARIDVQYALDVEVLV